MNATPSPHTPAPTAVRSYRIHPAWFVALAALVALIGAAGFRAAPGVLMVPLEAEFGWSMSEMSIAITLNLLLYGLMAPFAAALMQRFGIRLLTTIALFVIAAGSALTVFVSQSWQLLFTWGLLVGLGTGSMALVFAATITNTWFVSRRGLVSGILTAGSATGQLIFLPVIANAADDLGWRVASLIIAAGAVAVIPIVLLFLRNKPSDLGVAPYGQDPTVPVQPEPEVRTNPARLAIDALRYAAKKRAFWALAAGFAICGATTNGLVGTHFIPSAHDHGMPQTTAAGLLALVGIFDIAGTIFSGWLTDRINPRILLAVYYAGRGISLMFLPMLLSAEVHPPMFVFIIFYGLDWVATVPPTIALCREIFGDRGPLVFGWVFAAHQVGAGIATILAGVVRDQTGQYTYAWFAAAALCGVAAVISALVTRRAAPVPDKAPTPSQVP